MQTRMITSINKAQKQYININNRETTDFMKKENIKYLQIPTKL